MIRIRLRLLALMVVALALVPAAARAVYEVPIYQPGLTKFTIGIAEFKNVGRQPDPALAAKMRDLLVDDLLLSGYFEVIDKAVHLEKPGAGLTIGTFDFADWSMLRADSLVKAGFVLEGDNLTLEMRYFDVALRKQELGKRYTGKKDDYPSMIHRFGNEIILLLTGEPGIFGTRVAFISDRSGKKEVYTIGINGDGLQKLTAAGSISVSPAWSPDGKWITFSQYTNSQPFLFKVPSGGGKQTLVSGQPGLNIGAEWSPNGKEICLTLSRDKNSELYIITPEGEIKRRLTVSWDIEVSPSFAPGGNQLAFVSDRTGKPQIYVFDDLSAEQPQARRLTYQGSYNVSPAWSPKGDKILFQGLEGAEYQIYMTDPGGQSVYRISDGVGSNEDASWSPDGRAIVYSSNRTGKKQLYIMNIDQSFTKQLTSGNWNDSSPAWSPRLLQ